MKVSILTSSKEHPIFSHLQAWGKKNGKKNKVSIATSAKALKGGDVLFLISCGEIVKAKTMAAFKKTLVVHAADLPVGRGWSPHVWRVLEGGADVTVSLIEAGAKVDTGDIWAQERFPVAGHELHDEIHEKLFKSTLKLMDYAVKNFSRVKPKSQPDKRPTYYRKRTPEDSRLNPLKDLASQFDLLRISDPERYPAFFDYRGKRFKVVLEKISGRK